MTSKILVAGLALAVSATSASALTLVAGSRSEYVASVRGTGYPLHPSKEKCLRNRGIGVGNAPCVRLGKICGTVLYTRKDMRKIIIRYLKTGRKSYVWRRGQKSKFCTIKTR